MGIMVEKLGSLGSSILVRLMISYWVFIFCNKSNTPLKSVEAIMVGEAICCCTNSIFWRQSWNWSEQAKRENNFFERRITSPVVVEKIIYRSGISDCTSGNSLGRINATVWFNDWPLFWARNVCTLYFADVLLLYAVVFFRVASSSDKKGEGSVPLASLLIEGTGTIVLWLVIIELTPRHIIQMV